MLNVLMMFGEHDHMPQIYYFLQGNDRLFKLFFLMRKEAEFFYYCVYSL